MKFNILFVDDEKDILSAYKNLLEGGKRKKSAVDDLLSELNMDTPSEESEQEDNYIHFEASQGQDAVDIIKKQRDLQDPIHVCFVDFRMPPGINGEDTIKAIRDYDKDVEIVLVTAFSDVDLETIVKNVGTPEKLLFLKKPFDNKEVKQLILNLTRKYFDAKVRESFISNVTHELKTPLASILGFSQLLLEDKLNDEQREFIETILDNALLMKEQVDDLLTSANIAHRGLVLNKSRISVKQMVDGIGVTMSPLFLGSKLELKVECLDEFEIECDVVKIKQCLLNLLTNARKFTPEGVVSLKAGIDKKVGFFEVKDTGIGIPESKCSQIFDKFFRVEDEHHNTPGLGLGLSIVKRIIDAHNMSIGVKSELEKGTVFRIEFPLVLSQEVAA